MLNPFLSIYSTDDLLNKADEIKNTWENFMANVSNTNHLKSIVRNEIIDSWERCQSIGVNPEKKRATHALLKWELEQLLEESFLYKVAKPIIDNIYKNLVGTGYLITLNDENGRMLYLKGDQELMRKTETFNFAPGMDWSEHAAGTNAIGTSIASAMPIQVFSAEHFCEGFHQMTCSSSPIFHPYTKKVIGAVDLTGLWPSTQPHTLGLAVSLSQIIEQQMQSRLSIKYYELEQYYKSSMKIWRDNYLLVISDELVLVDAHRELLALLNIQKGSIVSEHKTIQSFIQNPQQHSSLFENFSCLKFQPIKVNQQFIGYLAIFKKNEKQQPSNYTQSKQLISQSPSMQNIMTKCCQVAKVDTAVLLIGETGTGKEVLAKYIHEVGNRKHKPFIAINCGAISKELIASELFGYESGSFTGAKKEGKKGKFEEANGGTIFLDEIGEMPLDLQVHLLRVLQEKEVTRIGSVKPIKLDIKIIAATNKNLEDMVVDGLFRQDLLFRLNVITFKIPALRDRKDDISLITSHYIKEFTEKYAKSTAITLCNKVASFFLAYQWPGNIRELKNAVEHGVIFCNQPMITREHLPEYLAEIKSKQALVLDHPSKISIIETVELQQINMLLEQTNWNLSAVAKELNIARSTLYRKLEKYNITKR